MAGHASGLQVGGVEVLTAPTSGKSIYVDCRTSAQGGKGAAGNPGTSADKPMATLAQAKALCLTGRGDTVYLLSADDTAASVFRTATAGLTWDLDNTHIVGVCAPIAMAQRARIAPPSTSTTTVTTLTVSGGNNRFENLHIWAGHSGDIDQFAMKVTGQRNFFKNCHFAFPGHLTPANRAGSRAVTLDGGTGTFLGENTFEDCTFGVTTVLRSAANALLGFLNATPRNTFRNCRFISYGDDGTALFVVSAAGGLLEFVEFDNCTFGTCVSTSGATAMVHGFSVPSDAGGDVWLHGCGVFGLSGTLVDADNAPVYTDLSASAAGGSKATRITHA